MWIEMFEIRRAFGVWMTSLMVIGPMNPAVAQQQQQQPVQQSSPSPASSASAAKPMGTTAQKDPGWPRIYSNGKATLTVHQPQIDDWKDFQTLHARMALEIVPDKGAKKQVAAVNWEARTSVDMQTRTVRIVEPKVTRFSVPGVEPEKAKELQALAIGLLPKRADTIAIDRVLPYLDAKAVPTREVKISTEAPPILVSTRPAILVMTDGVPILTPIESSKLTFVANTNWDLFKEGTDGDYYLLDNLQWLTAERLEGPWKSASKLPKDFKSLPPGENWNDTRKALPLSKDNKKRPAPWVYTSQKPAELILLDGESQFAPIPGTNLSEVTNTKSLLFYHNPTKSYYFLASGRWFRNELLRGDWEFVSDKLPEDFKNIPENHPKAHVLASVPGTPQAADAVLLASIPQTAVINRKKAAAEAKVMYVGEPEFKPIAGTEVQYAANTPSDVMKVKDKYYLCQEGVWFISSSAKGPWEVADVIPKEIYNIPPDSSKHHTTYVYVKESDSETVTTAQTAGYMGMAIGVGIGVAVWGTGYYYPPYYYYGAMYPYPVYWGYPYYSYGAAAWYNPATGFYGRGAVAYGPYGGYGRAAAYNPATGTYGRRAAAYGPYQAGSATSFYNPRTGAYGGGTRYANPYQGWGQGVVGKGDNWARGGYYYDERGAVGGIRTSEGGKMIAAGDGDNRGMIGRTSDGDLFAGKNGEIYRRDDSGNWQQRSEGGWNNVSADSLSPEQKQRADNARNTRQQNAQASNRAETGNRGQGQAGLNQPGVSNRAQNQPGLNQPGMTNRAQTQPGQMREGVAARPATGSVGSVGEMRSSSGTGSSRDSMSGMDRDAGARSRGNSSYGSSSRSSGGTRSGGFGGARMGGGRRR